MFNKDINRVKNKLERKYITYNSDGNVMTYYHVKNEELEGPLTLYNKYNQLLLKCNFIKGMLEGSFERFAVSRKEISLSISCSPYLRMGSKLPYQILHELNFENDKLHGQCNLYNSHHKLVGSGLFQNGNPVGTHNFYRHDDQLYYAVTFENGNLKEPIVFFDYLGQPIVNRSYNETRILNWIEKKQYLRWYTQIPSNEIEILNGSKSWSSFNNDFELEKLVKYSKTLQELFLNF